MERFVDGDALFVGVTIDVLHQRMAAGTCRAASLVDDGLERIARCDGVGPELRSLLAINPQARQEALECDEFLATHGRLRGPLHGIPVVLKDNCGTRDMPTTAGSSALAGFVPSADSAVARRLREAGAILLAKANLHEFALGGMTVSSLGGQTLNPYDLNRTPGGSSGGSAVAVAMGFCTLALGTDTVNSIRSPASANALVGLRPTRGLVSRAGIVPVSATQDAVGPIALSVRDAARTLDVLAGYDPEDPVTARSVGRVPDAYLDACDPDALRGRRLGLIAGFQGREARHDEVNRVVDQAVDVLRDAGAEVVIVEDPRLDADVLVRELDVQKWEFKTLLNAYLRAEPSAPVRSLSEIIVSGSFHPTLKELLLEAESVAARDSDVEYLRRLAGVDALRDHMFTQMAEHALDAFVYPLQRCLAVPLDSDSQSERNGILASLIGFPALNVPAGFSRPTPQAPLGVPIGLDIMARPFDEALLLGLGFAFEQRTRYRRPPVLARSCAAS